MKESVKIAIGGAILFVGSLVFGLGGTITAMVRSFNSVAESGGASADELSQGISSSLVSTAIGIPFAVVGLCLLIGGTVAYTVGGRQATAEKQSA